MNATTYGEMLARLTRWVEEGDYKTDDIVLWDLWSEEDYINLTDENVKVPWADVARRVDRKSDWLTEELSQYLIETADYIAESKEPATIPFFDKDVLEELSNLLTIKKEDDK